MSRFRGRGPSDSDREVEIRLLPLQAVPRTKRRLATQVLKGQSVEAAFTLSRTPTKQGDVNFLVRFDLYLRTIGVVSKVYAMPSYRLLVVDNDIARRHLYRNLEKQAESGACHVRQAVNGAAGLAELRAGTFHCMLLNFNLPDMTGFEFLGAAAIDGRLPCAVVVLSEQDDEVVAAEAAKRGVHGYLPKDQASTANLWNTITQAVMRAEAEQRHASLHDRATAKAALEQKIAGRDDAEAEPLIEGQSDHAVRPRRRSDFWFESPPGALTWALQSQSAAYMPSSPGRRVLIVDDLITNRNIIGAFLSNAGHMVTEAEGGEEAVWLASEQAFDVILMDIRMPQVDGLEATRRIRALSDPHGQVPILALTAHTLADHKTKCQDAGMDGHLAKPVDYNTLIRAVDNVIAASARTDQV